MTIHVHSSVTKSPYWRISREPWEAFTFAVKKRKAKRKARTGGVQVPESCERSALQQVNKQQWALEHARELFFRARTRFIACGDLVNGPPVD